MKIDLTKNNFIILFPDSVGSFIPTSAQNRLLLLMKLFLRIENLFIISLDFIITFLRACGSPFTSATCSLDNFLNEENLAFVSFFLVKKTKYEN